MANNKNDKKAFWLTLDNAAKIFPGQNTSTWSNSFRVCYELTETVDSAVLEQALKSILPRFPCYDVRIRRGFFWFYLEKNNKTPNIQQDIKNPCYRVKFKENNNFLFKVYYHGKRIAIDCYHVLTDGHGGAIFLSTLVAQYLRLKGNNIPTGGFVLNLDDNASERELEDSFVKHADSKAKSGRMEKIVYHANGTHLQYHTVNITSGIMPFDKLHEITKQRDVTVTEFFSALMLFVLYKKQKREKRKQKEISIQIPVDLRRTFSSVSLRNFTICMHVRINPNKGEYTFDEILTSVKYQLRLANNEKEHNAAITANLALEKNPFIRAVPLLIKNAMVGLSFMFSAEQTTSSLITNLGKVEIPEQMGKFVNKFIFMPAPGKLNAARCGVSTVNNKLVFTFSNSYVESDIEREFFTALVKMGIPVKIESNRE